MNAIYRMAGIMIVTLALAGVAVTSVSAMDQAVAEKNVVVTDDIKFEYSLWSKAMMAIAEGKPATLSKDFVIDIPPAPANTSAETQTELALLKKYAAEERTPEQIEKIKSENRSSSLYMVYAEQGLFDAGSHPLTSALIESVDAEVLYFTVREKKHFARARPTQLDPELTTVIDVPPHAAYPSGHAAQSYSYALVLSALDPGNSEKYINLALDIAHRREIAGVHYPSDSRSGQMLAKQVVEAMLKDEKIQQRLALAKKEFETH